MKKSITTTRLLKATAIGVTLLASLGAASTATARPSPQPSSTATAEWNGNGTTDIEGTRTLNNDTCAEDDTARLLWVLAGSKATSATISIDGAEAVPMLKTNDAKKGFSTFKYTMESDSLIDLDELESVFATYNDGRNKATLTISHGCLGAHEVTFNGSAPLLGQNIDGEGWSEFRSELDCESFGAFLYEGWVADCEQFILGVNNLLSGGSDATINAWFVEDDESGVQILDPATFDRSKLTAGTFTSQPSGTEITATFLYFPFNLIFVTSSPVAELNFDLDYIELTYDGDKYRYALSDGGDGGGGGGGGCSTAPVKLAEDLPVVTFIDGVLSTTNGTWEDIPGCTNTYTYFWENPETLAGVTQEQSWTPQFPGQWCDVRVTVRATNESTFSATSTSAIITTGCPNT